MEQTDKKPSTMPVPPKVKTKSKKRRLKAISLVVFGLLIGVGGTIAYTTIQTNNSNLVSHQTVKNDGNNIVTSQENTIEGVVSKVSGSVVSIVTNTTTQSYSGPAQQEAAGTGIIVSKDGYVLTNKHVVAGVNTVYVTLADGTTYDKVQVVGTDPLNDVAYLKIPGVNNLTPATLGDSSTVRIGQGVIAIGNSLGQYQNTVTSGIISGKDRPVTAGDSSTSSTESLTDLLQTDAAINPGNSGGPLLNLSGQVIGINTAVVQSAQGIGFAIPINATKGTLRGVLAGKGVQRAYLGLRYIPLTPDVAKQYKLSVNAGAYVLGSSSQPAVQVGGPADKSGIRDKDIITGINGLTVGPDGGVASLVGEYTPGESITVTLIRGGKTMAVKVTLGVYGS